MVWAAGRAVTGAGTAGVRRAIKAPPQKPWHRSRPRLLDSDLSSSLPLSPAGFFTGRLQPWLHPSPRRLPPVLLPSSTPVRRPPVSRSAPPELFAALLDSSRPATVRRRGQGRRAREPGEHDAPADGAASRSGSGPEICRAAWSRERSRPASGEPPRPRREVRRGGGGAIPRGAIEGINGARRIAARPRRRSWQLEWHQRLQSGRYGARQCDGELGLSEDGGGQFRQGQREGWVLLQGWQQEMLMRRRHQELLLLIRLELLSW